MCKGDVICFNVLSNGEVYFFLTVFNLTIKQLDLYLVAVLRFKVTILKQKCHLKNI